MVALSSEQAGLNKRGKSKLWIATRNGDLCRLFFAVMLAYADSSSLTRRAIYEQAKKDLCKRFDISSKAFNEVIRRENHRRQREGLATVETFRLWGGFKPGVREQRWPKTGAARTAVTDHPALDPAPACASDKGRFEPAPAFSQNSNRSTSGPSSQS